MEYIFLNASGQTLFVRSDIEQGRFVRHELTVTAVFPFDPGKVIQRGQRIAFRDPADDVIKVFEIRHVENREPDHAQNITAEHICIAELSDEHINTTEITNKTASEALTTALTGTLWSVGTNTASGTQNADFSRGSVWDAVNTIKQNWNVYIEPRIVISSAGVITGRYLDIMPAQGTFRGLRLSISKNLDDPCVTYNDDEVLTALYGYGGMVDKAQASGDDTQEELTFASQVWTATSAHPAKPLNQTYLEWPEKTALYGRNGRARYGYYQNSSITDPAVLLEKTWEALQKTCDPKVTIQGTAVDLYRLGYNGQPLRLHDIAIIEIAENGTLLNKEIICLETDLVNPDNDQVEIGDYIPNIIYINRETARNARGGGGGGGRGMNNNEDDEIKTYAELVKTNNMIGLVVGTKDGSNYIKGGEITLAINEDGGTTALIDADCIDIQGIITAIESYTISCGGLHVEGHAEFLQSASFEAGLSTDSGSPIDCGGVVNSDVGFTVGGQSGDKATWQSYTARYCTMTGSQKYVLCSNGANNLTPSSVVHGYLVGSMTNKVIHYLGLPPATPS